MADIRFTENLRAHVGCPPATVAGDSVRAALDAYFAAHPHVRSYVLDEQGALRRHITVFVDGVAMADRTRLAAPLRENSTVYVMQALSGG